MTAPRSGLHSARPHLRVAVEPFCDEHVVAAVGQAGAQITTIEKADALVWLANVDGFPEHLPDTIGWVALRLAGIEAFEAAGLIDDKRLWTNASGFYAENCAEHALTLLLSGLRQIPASIRTRWDKEAIDPAVRTLRNSTVGIVGAGGIGRALLPRLRGCGAEAIAVNRSGQPVDGAKATISFDDIATLWHQVDHIVVAAASTTQTYKIINARALAALPSHAWVVNVARGPLVDQLAVIDAVRSGQIAGAALDVTDPEPPASDDPIFNEPNIIVTPHIANPQATLTRELAPWVGENVRRYITGDELISRVR